MSVREARRSKRRAFEHVALIDCCDGLQPRPCEVRDISEGGARITVFADTKSFPDEFNLLLSPTAKVRRSCKVAWRSDGELGVRFLKPGE